LGFSYYIDTAHRADIFAIAQLSCTTGAVPSAILATDGFLLSKLRLQNLAPDVYLLVYFGIRNRSHFLL